MSDEGQEAIKEAVEECRRQLREARLFDRDAFMRGALIWSWRRTHRANARQTGRHVPLPELMDYFEAQITETLRVPKDVLYSSTSRSREASMNARVPDELLMEDV